MKFIDIHTHTPSFDSDDVISIVDISATAPPTLTAPTYCSYGIHPWFMTEKKAVLQLQQLETLLQNNAIIAIGEVGFDVVRGADMALQEHIFENVVTLSEHYRKPLIIHCVKAYDKLLSYCKNRKIQQKWIIHGFYGNSDRALQLTKQNIYLSFGAKLLNNAKLQSVFSKIPINFLFLETDTSKINITDIYQAAATIKKTEIKTIKHAVFENFMNTVNKNL